MKKGWEAHVLGEAPHYFKDAHTALKTLRVRIKQTGGCEEVGLSVGVRDGWRGGWGRGAALLRDEHTELKTLRVG